LHNVKRFKYLLIHNTIYIPKKVFHIKMNELKALSDSALKQKNAELELELAIERRKIASTGVSSKVIKLKSIRKTIARINTLLNQRGAIE